METSLNDYDVVDERKHGKVVNAAPNILEVFRDRSEFVSHKD